MKKNKKTIIFNTTLLLLIILFSAFIKTPNLYSNQKELTQLKKDINSLKDKYNSAIKKESNILDKIDIIDRSLLENRQIQDKITKTRKEIRQEKSKKEKSKNRLQNSIQENIQHIQKDSLLIFKIKENLANRYKVLYKNSRNKKNELLIVKDLLLDLNSLSNLNSFFKKKKYFDIVKNFDQKNLDNYQTIRERLDSTNAVLINNGNLLSDKIIQLKIKEEEQKKLLAIEEKEKLTFNKKKKERLALLKKVDKSKKLYKRKIAQKEKAAKKVQELIAKLEIERKLREAKRKRELEKQLQEEKKASLAKKQKKLNINSNNTNNTKKKKNNKFLINNNFSKSKKKLSWPVQGKVITKFGKYRNPKTKTYTFNSGIEIRTKKNNKVKAVSDGEIIKILWLRGYGNTIILEHGEGYYSVYSNLDKILKNENEIIYSGEAIAEVADDEKNKGKLHFEIWHKKQKLNPEKWLR